MSGGFQLVRPDLWALAAGAVFLSCTGDPSSSDTLQDSTGSNGSDASQSTHQDSEPPTVSAMTLGDAHRGQYHLGPVDFTESKWHNACAPGDGYRSGLHGSVGLGGEYLAGLSNEFAQGGSVCDACILIETELGHSIVARVVTYGVEQEPGDIDVSPSVFRSITEDEYPRMMSWTFARCPDAGNLVLEFQTESNPWWTSLWVRNPRVPLQKVEVRKSGSASFVELERASDGTLTNPSGFGESAFTLRITSVLGQTLEHELDGFEPGSLVDIGIQFD